MSKYTQAIREHYEKVWNNQAASQKWYLGPVEQLPEDFEVLIFPPCKMRGVWTYATCGMSLPEDSLPLELHLFTSFEHDILVELLTVVAHYHRNEAQLALGHTVNFGRGWLAGSTCDHGLVSLPYLDGPDLEILILQEFDTKVSFFWLIPVTKSEVEFRKAYGLEALERALEEANFDYLAPGREAVV